MLKLVFGGVFILLKLLPLPPLLQEMVVLLLKALDSPVKFFLHSSLLKLSVSVTSNKIVGIFILLATFSIKVLV